MIAAGAGCRCLPKGAARPEPPIRRPAAPGIAPLHANARTFRLVDKVEYVMRIRASQRAGSVALHTYDGAPVLTSALRPKHCHSVEPSAHKPRKIYISSAGKRWKCEPRFGANIGAGASDPYILRNALAPDVRAGGEDVTRDAPCLLYTSPSPRD